MNNCNCSIRGITDVRYGDIAQLITAAGWTSACLAKTIGITVPELLRMEEPVKQWNEHGRHSRNRVIKALILQMEPRHSECKCETPMQPWNGTLSAESLRAMGVDYRCVAGTVGERQMRWDQPELYEPLLRDPAQILHH